MSEKSPTAPSESLTVDSASKYFAGLLSQAPEDTDPLRDEELESEDGDESQQDEQLNDEEREQLDRLAAEEAAEADAQAKKEAEQRAQTFKVKVADEELDVTLDELIKGYSRTADYTRKTQALADQRRAAEADIAAVREQRQQYGQRLEQLQATLAAATPQEPDWARVRAEYPEQYADLWAQWQQHKDRLAALQTERERVATEEARDQLTAYEQYKAAEKAKLLEAIPEWQDTSVAKQEGERLVDFARSLGFTDQEIGAVDDHRTVLLLRTAMKFVEAQKKAPEIKAKVERIRAATPGGATPSKGSALEQRRQVAQTKLASTGKVADAAAFFETLLQSR